MTRSWPWLFAGLFLAVGCARHPGIPRVAVIGFFQAQVFDDVLVGLLEELAASGYVDGKSIQVIVKDAGGDPTAAARISRQFAAGKVDAIVPMGTAAAQSAVKATQTIPVVFCAVTNPVGEGIVDSLVHPGGNRTGATDCWPYDKQAKLIRDLLPRARKVGIICDSNMMHSQFVLGKAKPALEKYRLESVPVPLAATDNILAAVRSLAGRMDALLVPADFAPPPAFDIINKAAIEQRIPLFTDNVGGLENGAIAGYIVNYKLVGRVTGRLLVKILKEKAYPGGLPVTVDSGSDLIINLGAARKQGVEIPAAVMAAAARVIR